MPRAHTTRRCGSYEQSLFFGHIGQRELVRIQKSRRDRPSDPLCVSVIRLLGHEQVPTEQVLQGTENVSTAATSAQKKNIHTTPAFFVSGVNWNGMATQAP